MIANGFVRNIDGNWVNLNLIDVFYSIEHEEKFYVLARGEKKEKSLIIAECDTIGLAQNCLDFMMRGD